MNAIYPIRAMSSQERAYEFLKNGIINLDFTFNQKLRALDIANRLKISRTPVREALSRLEQERLVLREGGWGYAVRPLSFKDAMNVYRVREALEVEVVKEVIPKLDRDLTVCLEAYLERAGERLRKGRIDEYRENTRAFYRSIARATGNDVLEHMLSLIDDRIRLLGAMVAVRHDERPRHSLAGNREILAAVVKCDEALAESAVHKHVSAGRESFLKYVAATPGLFGP